jgi:integrase
VKRDALQLVLEAGQNLGLSTNARTKSGVIFDATSDHWSYRDGTLTVSVNFALLRAVSLDIKQAVKRVMLLLAQTGSPSAMSTYFHSFVSFLDVVAGSPACVTQIAGADYVNFAARAQSRSAAHVRTLLRKWSKLGAPGLASDVLPTVSATRLVSPPKGVAVATMDPKYGPYTDIEFQALQNAVNRAYIAGEMRPSTYAMTWLFVATGARPIQLSAMKVKDIHVREVDGAKDYSIDVPSAKRGGGPRAAFRNRPLVKSIGELILHYAAAVRASFAEKLSDPLEAPLFPAQFNRVAWASGFEHHHSPIDMAKELRRGLSSLNVVSERTGKPMHVTPIRFRRTFGTRAAQEGHGVLVIAELLDHVDTQHAGVYVETRPDIAGRIDKAVALELAPIAQAFAGKVLRSEDEATRAGDKSSRIRDLRITDEPLASCGQHSFCNMSAPFACYTCQSFEPWADAPHNAVLEFLLAKRARQLGTIDARIATVLDRTILAVAYVVHLCSLSPEQREHSRLPPSELDTAPFDAGVDDAA